LHFIGRTAKLRPVRFEPPFSLIGEEVNTFRSSLISFVLGTIAIGTSALAETANVSTLGTVGDNSPWSFSYTGVVTQPGPTYSDPTGASGSGTAVNVTPNGAWTSLGFASAPAGQSWWISTESDTQAPSAVISYYYQLTGFTVDSGDTLFYSFDASADNAVVGVEFVQGNTVIGTLDTYDWQANPPPAPYFYGFQGSITISGSGSGVIAPPPISVEFDVLNEADNNVYTSQATSPTGLAVTGYVIDPTLNSAPVPLPSSLLAGSVLMGILALARKARRVAV
jgi:hypothetical protein